MMRGRLFDIAVGSGILFVLIIGLLSGSTLLAAGFFSWHEGNYGFGSWGVLAGIAVMAVWMVVFGGAIWLMIWFIRRGGRPSVDIIGLRSALDILKDRYAQGEISRKQFEEMWRDLEKK